MRAERWPALGCNVKVVLNVRDLGGHLSVAARATGATLTMRLQRGAKVTRSFRWLPTPYSEKAQMVRGKAMPLALYGCEAVPCAECALNGFRTAILDTISPASTLRSPALAFSVASVGPDLDPVIQVFVRRAVMLRRMCCKRRRHD